MERDLGAPLAMLSADGGATRNDLLMQWQADLLGRPVQRVKILELSAFGAGALAGLASGFFDEATIGARLAEAVDVIAPRLDESGAARESARLGGGRAFRRRRRRRSVTERPAARASARPTGSSAGWACRVRASGRRERPAAPPER